jgi:hypothetical protein
MPAGGNQSKGNWRLWLFWWPQMLHKMLSWILGEGSGETGTGNMDQSTAGTGIGGKQMGFKKKTI